MSTDTTTEFYLKKEDYTEHYHGIGIWWAKILQMVPLSCYILTYNSEKYLAQILTQAIKIADDILIVDSGSTDNTLTIAQKFGVRIINHPLSNFREQRAFATASCKFDTVLFFDSDEVPSDELVAELKRLKSDGFPDDAYAIKREWYVLGKKVHALCPVVSPDYPIRVLNRKKVAFDERSHLVHEEPHGYESLHYIHAPLTHLTYQNMEELNAKLQKYSAIAAHDVIERKRSSCFFLKMIASPPWAWFKWYIIKGGCKDGVTGLVLAKYAFDYTYLKYRKAIEMQSKNMVDNG
jgi:glycosyltransferase involved in cell wall biosynthesis